MNAVNHQQLGEFAKAVMVVYTSDFDAEIKFHISQGMFMVDDLEFLDEQGNLTSKTEKPQIGGGGTYAAIGARVWLPPDKIGMIIDRGSDFTQEMQSSLDAYGKDMWLYRDNPDRMTTRSLMVYQGDTRSFKYIIPGRKVTHADIQNTRFDRSANLHFVCSPPRAELIVSAVRARPDWNPVTIYEPVPEKCVPGALPGLVRVLPGIDILSPNAEEALSLLSMQQPPTKEKIEEACSRFLRFGVGPRSKGYVVIRSGALGAYFASHEAYGRWIDAYWSGTDNKKVVDVTGAGNSFLGGLSAGLLLAKGNIIEAILYATVSASFTVEQASFPKLTVREDGVEMWNGDIPARRLQELRSKYSI